MARIDEFMAWQHLGLRSPTSRYIVGSLKPEILGGTPPGPADYAHYKTQMEAAMDQMETVWLETNKFINGDEISIADLLAIGEIEMTRKLIWVQFSVVFINATSY